jgi:dipeptidase E
MEKALVELLGKPIAESSALVIPTAAYYFLPNAGIAYRLISGTGNGKMCELGWKSMGVLELTALPSVDKDQWVPLVQETDALLFGGGDPMYLCRWMRDTGLVDLFPSLKSDTVYVGLSAGSMAVTSSFGESYNGRDVPKTGVETPLGLIDIAMCCHMDNEKLPDNSMADIETWAADISVPTYGIDDETAIQVVDGTIDVISEGNWKVFEPLH